MDRLHYHCDAKCLVTMLVNGALLGYHLFIHAEALHAWANGNLILIWSSAWFVFISIWNVLVMLEYPEVMVMAKWTRVLPFFLCIVFLSYFFAGVAIEIIKVSRGETWKDSVEEIFFAYVLWIQTPTAIVEGMYVANMVIHSDDIRLRNDDEEEEDEDEDDDDE